MPRIPEVYPSVFCPHSSTIAPRFLRILPLASGRLPSAVCRLPPVFSAVCLLLLLITYHSSLSTVHAQSATATLSGSVVDPNGAVIPGVNVAVINLSQGFQRTTTTNTDGIFVVPLLPPATYTVKAEHQGFTTAEVRDVVLNVNDQVRLNIQLKVGGITGQTVDIVDAPPLIDESPAVGTTVDRQFVGNLPLNGRSFQSLITLTPGTVLTGASGVESGQFSVNGQRADANYFTVDGVSANVGTTYGVGAGYSQSSAGALPALAATGGTNNLVSVDALQEFKVLTSTYAPEFGRSPGGQVSIVTRSGTNDFHGTLFEYFRNDAFDANDWFANSRGRNRAALRQNIFGGTFGGPVLLPRFGEGGSQPWYNGRNKTFFFFSYEGHRLRLPKFQISAVPSLSARQDPSASPIIKQLLNAYPVPTGPEQADRFAEFAAGYSDPSSLDATSVRIDHTLSQKLTLFGRYNYSPSENVARAGATGTTLNTLNSLSNRTQTLTIGATSSLTSEVSNEFRGNWTKVRGRSVLLLDNFGGAVVPPRSFFLPSTALTSNTFIEFTEPDGTTLRVGTLADNLQRQINVVDNVSLARNSHQWRFGIDYRRLYPVHGASNYTSDLVFDGINGMLTGRTLIAVIGAAAGPLFPIFNNFSAYGQDTWKATHRLTLTYGLRWELNPPPHEKNGNDPAVLSGQDNPATMTLAAFGTPLYTTTYNNFAPRIGAAYQLSQKPGRETILRGGFGIFYDLGNDTAAGAFGQAFPFLASKTLAGAAAPFFPLTPAEAAPPSFSRNLPTTNTVIAFDPHLKLPRTYQWNVAIEQSFGANQTVSASYVAALGRRLLRQDSIRGTGLNNPNFGTVTFTKNTATSDYHALQLQFQRRLSRHLQALASYTWSHSIDIASRDSATMEAFSQRSVGPSVDRGNSDFDIRHGFRFAATYNIPGSRFGKTLLRDWSVDAIYTAQSAMAVDILFQRFNSAFGPVFPRPDLIQGVPLYLDDPKVAGGRRINRAAFSIPTVLRQGSLGRNSLRGFPLSQLDAAMSRRFRFSERANVQFKTEFFNLFNHPNFAKPSFILSSSTFGQSTSMFGRGLGTGGLTGGLNPLYQVGGPRSIQFSIRLEY
jgi:hypothetical protein